MEMRILVQGKDKLDPQKAVEFIDFQDNAKIALIHASVDDELILADYLEHLIQKLKTPFAGTRVSGFITKKGYMEKGITITLLCGDFQAEINTTKIDYEKPEKTIDEIVTQTKNKDLCLVYSANHIYKTIYIDHILRKTQEKNPNTQFYGCISSPTPIVYTKKGMYEDTIATVTIKGVETDYNLATGFTLTQEKDQIEITKSDQYHVYEINNKNAVEEYCRIQHMRPYFLNMIAKTLTKTDAAKLAWGLARASKTLYEGVLKFTLRGYGGKTDEETIEPFAVFELETEKGRLITNNYKPEGTKLTRVDITKQSQLDAYDYLRKKQKTNNILIHSCVYTQIYFDFDHKALEQKMEKYKQNYQLLFTFGEVGAKTPYKKDRNLTHGAVITALGLK